MSGHCRCVNLSPIQDFPIDAPCPPLSLSYSSFHEHAISQGVGLADILKIAEQCNLKATEIITPGPEKDTNWPWWLTFVVVLVSIVLVFLAVGLPIIINLCRKKNTLKGPKEETNLASNPISNNNNNPPAHTIKTYQF